MAFQRPTFRDPGVDSDLSALTARVKSLEIGWKGWNHAETFALVNGQRDYLFAAGLDADTDPAHALVQWGAVTLIPGTDYQILTDRIRLASAVPSSTIRA